MTRDETDGRFETFVDVATKHATRVCGGLAPLASEESFAEVRAAYQAWMQAEYEQQEEDAS